MKRTDAERLADIAEALAAIRGHAKRRGDERLRRDALLYNLLVVGEAVKAVSEELKAREPEVPWRAIAGLRDLLAHEYYEIDIDAIDDIVERDLPPLAAAVGRLRRSASRQRPASSSKKRAP